MTEFVCHECRENCAVDDCDLEDAGVLIGEKIRNVPCPYAGIITNFQPVQSRA